MKVIDDMKLNIDDDEITGALHAIEDLLKNGTEEDYQNALHMLAEKLDEFDIDVQAAIGFAVKAMKEFGIPVPDEPPTLDEVIDMVEEICA